MYYKGNYAGKSDRSTDRAFNEGYRAGLREAGKFRVKRDFKKKLEDNYSNPQSLKTRRLNEDANKDRLDVSYFDRQGFAQYVDIEADTREEFVFKTAIASLTLGEDLETFDLFFYNDGDAVEIYREYDREDRNEALGRLELKGISIFKLDDLPYSEQVDALDGSINWIDINQELYGTGLS